MTVQQERRIKSLTEQVHAWKSIVRTYQTETDKKLLDDLAETKIILRNVERELADTRLSVTVATDALDAVRALHVQDGDVCEFCFNITTYEQVYSWPCPTARAAAGDTTKFMLDIDGN